MNTTILESSAALGKKGGSIAAHIIREAIATKGQANVILATGTSQFETLQTLIASEGIDWSKIVMFHLDEYIGLPVSHPASFRKYLLDRFLAKVPTLKASYLIDGEGDASAECERLGNLISQHPIDVALVGIGENGHLAFNDPPADFDTEQPYIVVDLDEQCRTQQMNEGWFATMNDVPRQAISMSVRQIMKSANIICSVPELRKAKAVKDCLENEISNLFPASILRQHTQCELLLEPESASLLTIVK